ncbi:hypothetical protein JCM11251_006290 [Rhodosporidiobolus azoricus]
MEILSEAESRSFSQFLDHFSSSTTAAPAADPNFLPPPPYEHRGRTAYGQDKLAGISRIGPAGGAAPLGGWADPASRGGRGEGGGRTSSLQRYRSVERGDTATVRAMSGFGYGAAQLPPPPSHPIPSSFPPSFGPPTPGADAFLPPPSQLPPQQHQQPYASTSRHQLYSAPNASSSFGPPSHAYPSNPPPLHPSSYPHSHSYPRYSAPPAPPLLSPNSQAEQKRVRMAQQAHELEEMMRASGQTILGEVPPSRAARSLSRSRAAAGAAIGEGPQDDEEDSPPLKRTKSDEDSEGVSRMQTDPIALMLEAEKRVGFRSSTTAGRFRQQQRTGFAAPPAHTTATAFEEEETDLLPDPSSPPPAPAKKRKAPAPRKARASSSKSASASATMKPEDEEGFAAGASIPSTILYPYPTPNNIPLAPLRRSRPSASTSAGKPTSSNSPPPLPGSNAAKPALLSAAQKKANHIASEQKRRAAIRAGYDGLCQVVPSLRAAVEEYEGRLAALSGAGGGGSRGKGGGGRKGKGRGGESTTGALMGGIEVGGEKVDGRAGPKSEAVVLSKTVDHLRHLLTNRQNLLLRLSTLHLTASSHSVSLPPPPAPAGYPGSKQLAGEWEEQWEEGGWMVTEVLGMLGLAPKGKIGADAGNGIKEEEEGSEEEVDEDVPGA